MYNICFTIDSIDSDECIAEYEDSECYFIPRIGDSIFALEFPDSVWAGDEYTEWAEVVCVRYAAGEKGAVVKNALFLQV